MAQDGSATLLARYASDGSLDWARALVADEVSATRVRVAGDAVLVVGGFRGTLTLGEGEPSQTQLVSLEAYIDAFLAAYGSDGSLRWAARIGGHDVSAAADVVVLSDGSLIVGGEARSAVVVASGTAEQVTLVPPPGAWSYGWMARFDNQGRLVWAQRVGGTEHGYVHSIAAGAGDGFADVGRYHGPGAAVFGEGQPGQVEVAGDAVVLTGWSGEGEVQWAATEPPTAPGRLTATADGGWLLGGAFANTVTLGAGQPAETIMETGTGLQPYVARYGPGGALLWAAHHVAGEEGRGYALDVQPTDDGGAVAVGVFTHTTRLGTGEANETTLHAQDHSFPLFNGYMARYGGSGRLSCALSVVSMDPEGQVYPQSVSRLPDGSWLVAGSFQHAIELGEGPSRTVLTAIDEYDLFFARYAF